MGGFDWCRRGRQYWSCVHCPPATYHSRVLLATPSSSHQTDTLDSCDLSSAASRSLSLSTTLALSLTL